VISAYTAHVLILMGIFVVLTLGLNLIVGYAGQVSLGHAAFFGIGAYTSALLVKELQWPWLFAFCAAGLVASAFGVVLGLPTLRLRHDYLAIVTLGFGEVVRFVILNTEKLGGTTGIVGIPKPVIGGHTFKSKDDFLLLVGLLVLGSVIIVWRISVSKIGQALRAIREHEDMAMMMGVETVRYKVVIFGIGALLAGLAGSAFAHYAAYIHPSDFGLEQSITIMCMVVLGGLGSITGSIVGAVTLVALPEVIRDLQQYTGIVYGALLLGLMLLRPKGLLGKIDLRRK
jgi:branched-chain amino acid transport system permease protein